MAFSIPLINNIILTNLYFHLRPSSLTTLLYALIPPPDFCLWGPPEPNSLIGDTEGESVAWCTKPGRGTRVIPPGALQGVQYMRTPDYVQVVGYIDQSLINIAPEDYGGEMDPHGADLRGNPLGGIVFSNAWSGDNNTYVQAIEWHKYVVLSPPHMYFASCIQ